MKLSKLKINKINPKFKNFPVVEGFRTRNIRDTVISLDVYELPDGKWYVLSGGLHYLGYTQDAHLAFEHFHAAPLFDLNEQYDLARGKDV